MSSLLRSRFRCSLLPLALAAPLLGGCSSAPPQAATAPTPALAATPTFTPAAGTYTATQSVALADAFTGAAIFYTTDGTTPTTSSPKYATPIVISQTETVQAIATATGYTASSTASAAFTILPPTPSISLSSGTYTSTQSVTLAVANSTATIFYSTDGSQPTTASTPYTAPFPVSASETLKAVAALGGQLSAAATATYVVNLPPASISAYAGGGQSAQAGAGFATPLQVQVLDTAMHPAAGVGVTFSAPASGPGATFSAPSCTTGSNGVCSVTARANSAYGTFTVNAVTAAGLGTAFTLTNTGAHSFLVTVATDTTTGIASNCTDQAVAAGNGNANCSLRDATTAAAAVASSAQPATITFAQTLPTTITLQNGPIPVPPYTVLQGATSGAGLSLTNLITVDGNQAGSVFTAAAAVTQSALNNLIITHGSAAQVGGGLYTLGSLAVNNTTFSANQASASGGAISNNGGTLTVFGTTFANNSAPIGYGGGIDNFGGGTATVSNSTFSGNTATTGGALYSSGTVSVNASTLSGNTATSGGGLYNKGAMTVASSIVNGNSPTNCAGLYCSPLWAYVVFSAVTLTPVDTGNITIAFTDTLGYSFSQTAAYGQFSTPAALASTFGPYFYYNTSGLDTASITGQGIGNLLVITPENGAMLNPFTITNPGRSFTATQMQYPDLLSLSPNVYDQSTSSANVAPLASNGGPTQTILPQTGSTALCLITPSTATGTDQRGQPRTVTVGTSTCQDAGSVQTAK